MGFYDHWVDLATACVSSVTNSELLNGEPHVLITPSHGLS
jgi:hypothetical protein